MLQLLCVDFGHILNPLFSILLFVVYIFYQSISYAFKLVIQHFGNLSQTTSTESEKPASKLEIFRLNLQVEVNSSLFRCETFLADKVHLPISAAKPELNRHCHYCPSGFYRTLSASYMLPLADWVKGCHFGCESKPKRTENLWL